MANKTEETSENAPQASDKSAEAPKKYRSIKNLVTRVLEPMVGNYFRNAAQDFEALDFLDQCIEIQQEAAERIKAALSVYGVQAIGTFINEIDLLDELEEQLTTRKILMEQRKTIEEEVKTEKYRQYLIEQQEKKKIRSERVRAQENVKIAKLNAQAEIIEARGKAEVQRQKDEVNLNRERQQLAIAAAHQKQLKDIDVNEFREIVKILGPDIYAKLESDKAWTDALAKLKIDMPEIFIGGNNGNPPGADALQAGTMQLAWMDMLRDMLRQRDPNKQINMIPKVEALDSADDD